MLAVQEASTAESSASASPVPQMGPMEIWGQAFDAASAQLAEHINPAEVYEISDLRALHAVNIIEQDGAMQYEEKCHDLAIAALSAVKAGLSHQHANLAHCRLSRKGAHALAHALACNATIQRLTLQSNHIDGEVSEAPVARDCTHGHAGKCNTNGAIRHHACGSDHGQVCHVQHPLASTAQQLLLHEIIWSSCSADFLGALCTKNKAYNLVVSFVSSAGSCSDL
jgi:hypothetical protein